MDTVLACLTPPGKAAIATLAVRGPLAWPITRELFRPAKGALPTEPAAGQFWFGTLGLYHAADDVILTTKSAAHLELHCHGGVEVVRMLQELYAQRGVAIVPWQAFVDDARFALLAQAPTPRTAAILLDQTHIDWPACINDASLPRLRELIPLGRHLVEPWQIVIAGAPNVGKSSLMNALAGYTRSIVSATPGTTRDVVRTRLAIDGWPVELVDTAGIRPSTSDLEQRGIQRAHDAMRDADLRLWLLDGSTAPIFPETKEGWQFVINKIDLPAAWDGQQAKDALRVSAHTQAGLPELCDAIARRLVPSPPVPGEAVPCLPEHFELLGAVYQ